MQYWSDEVLVITKYSTNKHQSSSGLLSQLPLNTGNKRCEQGSVNIQFTFYTTSQDKLLSTASFANHVDQHSVTFCVVFGNKMAKIDCYDARMHATRVMAEHDEMTITVLHWH